MGSCSRRLVDRDEYDAGKYYHIMDEDSLLDIEKMDVIGAKYLKIDNNECFGDISIFVV